MFIKVLHVNPIAPTVNFESRLEDVIGSKGSDALLVVEATRDYGLQSWRGFGTAYEYSKPCGLREGVTNENRLRAAMRLEERIYAEIRRPMSAS